MTETFREAYGWAIAEGQRRSVERALAVWAAGPYTERARARGEGDVKKVTMFEASDGLRFETEEEAMAHESLRETRAKVDVYLSSLELTAREHSRRRNVILEWEAYKRQGELFEAADGEDGADGEVGAAAAD